MNSPLVMFYLGSHPDHRGWLLSEILDQDDLWLEATHDFIQWLFPNREPSRVNAHAPILTSGVIAAFLEASAVVGLSWSVLWEELESGRIDLDALEAGPLPRMAKTIDFTVDYLRSGLPRDAYARARVNRSGRRYASVHVEAWQDNRARLFAQGTGHFLMPERDG